MITNGDGATPKEKNEIEGESSVERMVKYGERPIIFQGGQIRTINDAFKQAIGIEEKVPEDAYYAAPHRTADARLTSPVEKADEVEKIPTHC